MGIPPGSPSNGGSIGPAAPGASADADVSAGVISTVVGAPDCWRTHIAVTPKRTNETVATAVLAFRLSGRMCG